tara:strand:- start:15 stop:536 length:522 start_codon:yes stop_codon:yes gene_type:complete
MNKTLNDVKKREKPNDVFITPLQLAKNHIDMIPHNENDVWYDPFKNNGSYYNQFPNENKLWSEILEGKDFFEFNENIDVICSNPPYSLMDKVLKKSIELNPHTISYLIGIHNLTTRRIEYMEKAGYYITKIHLTKVFKWFGMSIIVIWEKNKNGIIDYDRTIWKNEEKSKDKK